MAAEGSAARRTARSPPPPTAALATARLSACERTVRISGEIEFNELIKEHSATNLDEYVRVQESPRGHRLQFVYCVEELMDRGEAPKVFKLGAGGDVVAVKAERLPEVYRRSRRRTRAASCLRSSSRRRKRASSRRISR